MPRIPDPHEARRLAEETRLLTKREMKKLFPDGRVEEERLLGLTKSSSRAPRTSSAPSSSFAAQGYGSLASPRNSSSPWSSAVSSSFVIRPNTRRMRRLSMERR